jgi:hypothetical protein
MSISQRTKLFKLAKLVGSRTFTKSLENLITSKIGLPCCRWTQRSLLLRGRRWLLTATADKPQSAGEGKQI